MEGAVDSKLFGKTSEGCEVYEYTLTNRIGAVLKVITYGATIRELWVPARDGKFVDVVLGFDTLEEYEVNPGYVGATVGRYANRIAYGRFSLDGVQYQLALNDRGRPNSLHGGFRGFSKVVWRAVGSLTPLGPSVTFRYLSHDGEEGFPGNLDVSAVFTLTNENELVVEFTASTDKPTVVNLTNHSYFNLSGEGTIHDHVVELSAEQFTPVNEHLVPTGEICDVSGTPLDLRSPTRLGEAIERLGGWPTRGFDFNYVLKESYVGTFYSPRTGIRLEVRTSQPGFQFYTANALPVLRGKAGKFYDKHHGFCIETQHFPDSPNHPNFPSTVLRPGEIYHHWTIFKFTVD